MESLYGEIVSFSHVHRDFLPINVTKPFKNFVTENLLATFDFSKVRTKILNLHVSLVRMKHFANCSNNDNQVCTCDIHTAHAKDARDVSHAFPNIYFFVI